MPIRAPSGFCIRCAADEIGEAIGKNQRRHCWLHGPVRRQPPMWRPRKEGAPWDRFRRRVTHGYLTVHGRPDAEGSDAATFTLLDRGMTSLSAGKARMYPPRRVAATIAAFPALLDAVVYGVSIPGSDGRAGMAAVISSLQAMI